MHMSHHPSVVVCCLALLLLCEVSRMCGMCRLSFERYVLKVVGCVFFVAVVMSVFFHVMVLRVLVCVFVCVVLYTAWLNGVSLCG